MALVTALSLLASLALMGCGAAVDQEPPTAETPVSVTLTPVEDYNPMRTQHTLVAQVTDPAGDPVSGERVEWILNRAPRLVGDVVSLSGSEAEDAGAIKTDNTFGIATSDDNGEVRLTITATRARDTEIAAGPTGPAGETGGTGETGDAAVSTISITPCSFTLAPTTTHQFTATAKDTSGNTVSVSPTWSVEAGGGTVYTVDAAGPACRVTDDTLLTTAIGDMQIAYDDAAGRPTPDFTELLAGDLSNQTLVPGLYKWGPGVSIDNRGVTLSEGEYNVWIFQIAGDLTVANDAIVTLADGAQAKNFFWQVGGQSTLGTAV